MDTTASAARRQSTQQKIRSGVLLLLVVTFAVTMNYFSVFLIIEGSAKGIATFSLIFWGLFTLTALFFGRAACGYICPLGAFQEIKDRMVPKKLARIKHLKVLKYVLAVAWVGGIVFAAIHAGGYHGVDLLYNTRSGVSVDTAQSWITYGMIVSIVLIPAFLIGRRGFCHYFCPWGVLNTAATQAKGSFRWPSLHLSVTASKCRRCKTCDTNCPMSLPISDMVQNGSMKNAECILCGTCVGNCPNRAIAYSWGRPIKNPESKAAEIMAPQVATEP